MATPIETLRDAYRGQTCWVVGSGQSLRYLQASDFGEGPVIAVNWATPVVESLNLENPVYSMQKDAEFCKTKLPTLSHFWESGKSGWGTYVFDNNHFGLSWNNPSLVSAVKIAELWGCTQVVFLCCDSMKNGDIQSYEHGEVIKKDCRFGYMLIGKIANQIAEQIHMPVEWR